VEVVEVAINGVQVVAVAAALVGKTISQLLRDKVTLL
jgi:hypothetical protein